VYGFATCKVRYVWRACRSSDARHVCWWFMKGKRKRQVFCYYCEWRWRCHAAHEAEGTADAVDDDRVVAFRFIKVPT